MHWQTRRGTFDLYGIEDGHRFTDPAQLYPTAPEDVWTDHPERLVEGRLRHSLGCFLVRTTSDLVMIDTGMGRITDLPEGMVAGQMPATLAMIGVRPEDVDHVILTHLHRDHIGGLRLSTGDAYFPDARVWVSADELDYWMADETERGDAARAVMQGFVDEGRVETLTTESPVTDGVRALSTPGHTPGHMSVELRSEDTRTVIAGDVTLHPFQATLPDVNVPMDVDPEQAARTRAAFFADLADTDARLAAGHYPRPGYGRVQSIDDRRVFVVEPPDEAD